MVAMVGGWFEERRTTALGIAVAGIGAGTLVCAPLAAQLIEAHGWRRSYVIFAIGGVLAMALATLGTVRAPSKGPGGRVDLRAVTRQRPFVVLYLGSLALSLALFVPFVFIKSYATERGVEAGRAALLVGLIGAASIVGRLGLGALGARLGPTRLLQGSFSTMAVSYLIWMASDGRYGLLVAYTIVMGVGYGGFIALTGRRRPTLRYRRDGHHPRRDLHGGRHRRAHRPSRGWGDHRPIGFRGRNRLRHGDDHHRDGHAHRPAAPTLTKNRAVRVDRRLERRRPRHPTGLRRCRARPTKSPDR